MRVSRRSWLRLTTAWLAWCAVSRRKLEALGRAAFKVGVTDWNLRLAGQPASIALAKKIGFDGVQVSIGRGGAEQPSALPLSDPGDQQAFLAESRRVGLPIASVCLDILHRNGLKSRRPFAILRQVGAHDDGGNGSRRRHSPGGCAER